MNIDKCKTCKNYESFFGGCNLYYEELYIGEGDFDIRAVNIKNVNKLECKYEQK